MGIILKSSKAMDKAYRKTSSFLGVVGLILLANCCKAQLNPYQAIYFENRYLVNPAMAALDKGLTLNLAYQRQWIPFPGAPTMQAATFEYQATEKMGLGLNVNDEQSGLFRQTRLMGTYAYHLPLSDENQKLNFGLSLGVGDSRINYSDVVGDLTDIELSQYNQKGPYVDADVGISYTSDNLFVEGVVPNLNTNLFNRDNQRADVDRTVFLTAISYKIMFSDDANDFTLEPLAALRAIKGFNDIGDLGLNFRMPAYHLDLHTIYHTNDNWGLGFTLDEPTYAINFNYNIYQGPISNSANGAFEFGLKLRLFNK